MRDSFPTAALNRIYGPAAAECERSIREAVRDERQDRRVHRSDGAWLLAYPTHLRSTNGPALNALNDFVEHLGPAFDHVHLLPPFTSAGDFGFAPTNHFDIEPGVGDWDDIGRLGQRKSVSIDLIVNHVAPEHPWALQTLAGDATPCDDPFIRVDPDADYSGLARSRHHPPVTPFVVGGEVRHYWTRYGAHQIDLDYRKPCVLVAMIRVLVEYRRRGLNGVRLDALAFIWKDLRKLSANEPEVFDLLEVIRWVADEIGLSQLIAEGDVSAGRSDYVSSDGSRATIAYRYEAAPVILATLVAADRTTFMRWIAAHHSTLHETPALNFLSTHDGVYLRPTDSPLTEHELEILSAAARRNGGTVVERVVADEVQAYELDITVVDLLDSFGDGEDRLVAGLTLVCWLPGTPLIYLGHLLALRNDDALVRETSDQRARNRGSSTLEEALKSIESGVGRRIVDVLERCHASEPLADAFLPTSPVLPGPDLGQHVVTLIRVGPTTQALCILTLSEPATVRLPPEYCSAGRNSLTLDRWGSEVIVVRCERDRRRW